MIRQPKCTRYSTYMAQDPHKLDELELGIVLEGLVKEPADAEPVIRLQNDRVYIYQGNRDPLIMTRNQFDKLAVQLGFSKK